MPRIYRLSKTGLRLLYKLRHHRGHGIHSPFVFNLITKVIEEKRPFYAYEEIKDQIADCFGKVKPLKKSDLLSFRLVNYFNSEKILELGAGTGISTLCLTAASTRIECQCVELSPKKLERAKSLFYNWDRNITLYSDKLPETNGVKDCICVNLKNYEADFSTFENYLFPMVSPDSFIIIKGIRTNKQHQALWKYLRDSDKVTVSLDLFHEGILFFDPKLFKKNYRLSF